MMFEIVDNELTVLSDTYRDIITAAGEDPFREGLLRTPLRAAKALKEMTAGYTRQVECTTFPAETHDPVILTNIPVYSLCEHHLLPFLGVVHVTYEPRDKIIGLSKIPRLVEMYASRFQVQERLTAQIADHLMEVLNPIGVGVVTNCRHLCLEMRGAKVRGADGTMIPAFRGELSSKLHFLQTVRSL